MSHESTGHVLHRARLYDLGTSLSGRGIRRVQEPLLERAAIAAGENVLDVGCGPGRLTLEAARLAGPSAKVVGIDPSPEMIALAKRKAERQRSTADFLVAPVQAIPEPDGSFDVVLASLVLHHVPAAAQPGGLAELLRVLKPGGRLIALDFAGYAGHGVRHLLAVLGLLRGSENAEHLRSLMVAAGFENVEMQVMRAHCLLWGGKPGGGVVMSR